MRPFQPTTPVAALLTLLLSSVGAVAQSHPVTFADADIEAAVRTALNQPTGPLTAADVATVTAISLPQKRIQDLSGLEQCTGLKSLDLSGNWGTPRPGCTTGFRPNLDTVNLSPISSLVNLEDLNLADNDISDISGLAPLVHLKSLNLEGNYLITDAQAIAGLTLLESLSIGLSSLDEKPARLAPLAGLTSMRRLDLYASGLVSLEPLREMTQLESLTIAGGLPGLSLKPLTGKSHLQDLMLNSDSLTSLDGLEGCTALRTIDATSNEIHDISSLRGLIALEDLKIGGDGLQDVGALAHHPVLKNLELDGLGDSVDFAPLGTLPALETLSTSTAGPSRNLGSLGLDPLLNDLSVGTLNTQDLVGLARAPKLAKIYATFPTGTDLGAIATFPSLITLAAIVGSEVDLSPLGRSDVLEELFLAEIDGRTVEDLNQVLTAPHLRTLGIGAGGFNGEDPMDFGSATNCGALRELYVTPGMVPGKVSGLPRCENLETLHVGGSGVPDLSILASYPHLKKLTITSMGSPNLAPITQLLDLEELDVAIAVVDDLTPLDHLPILKTLRLSVEGSMLSTGVSSTVLNTQIPTLRARGVTVTDVPDGALRDEQLAVKLQMNQILSDPDFMKGPKADTLSEAPAGVPTTPVDISDPGFAADLRYYLDDDPAKPLTQADLATLTHLTCPAGDPAPKNLEGIQYCTSLTELTITYCPGLHDLTPLVGLPKLTTVEVMVEGGTDLAPLATLPALTTLTVHVIPGGALDPSPLGLIRTLTSLDVSDTGISDLSSIGNLYGLTSLSLGKNPIRDLGPLNRLSGLQSLTLNDTLVADLTPLAHCSGLTGLWISYDPDQAVPYAKRGAATYYFDAGGVADLTPLHGLTHLQMLDIERSEIRDLSGLAGLPALESLNLEGNPISDCHGLAGLPALKTLNLDRCPLTSFDGLAGCPTLIEVSAEGCKSNPDCRLLATLPALTTLNLSDAGLTSFVTLAHLPAIRTLNVSLNDCIDLGPLSNLVTLEDLDCYGQRLRKRQAAESAGQSIPPGLTDLTPLGKLPNLRELSVSNNQVTDLTALIEGVCFPSGGDLDVEDNPLTAAARKSQIGSLEQRGVRVLY